MSACCSYYCSNYKNVLTWKNESKYVSWNNELSEVQIVKLFVG